MKRSSRTILGGAALVAAALAIGFWWTADADAPTPAPAVDAKKGVTRDDRLSSNSDSHAGASALHQVYVEVTAADHTPLAAAAVKIVALSQTRDGITDADGMVTFDGITRRVIRVEISARGYLTKKVTPAPLTDDTPEVSWTFLLERDPKASDADANVVTGAVVCEGKPVVGATVFVVRGDNTLTSANDVKRTDSTGRFVIPVATDGADEAAVTKLVAMHRSHGEGEAAYTGADIVITLPPGGFIEGRVTTTSGELPDRVTLQAIPTFVRLHPLVRDAAKRVRRTLRRTPKAQKARELKMVLDHLMRGKSVRLSAATGGGDVRKETSKEIGKEIGDGEEADAKGVARQPGSFRLGPLAASSTSVVASAKGFEPDSVDVNVNEGKTTKNVTLTLLTPLTITGVVTDADTGTPLKGVEIRANTRGTKAGKFARAQTNKNGEYTLQTHAEERQTISAWRRGYLAFDVGGVYGDNGDTIVRDIELRSSRAGDKGRRGHNRDYVGIGAQLKKTDDGVLIQKIFNGGAASEQLNEGDIIVQVDGEWLEDIALGIAVESILGEDGTEVELVVRRKGKKRGDTETVLLERRRIQAGGG